MRTQGTVLRTSQPSQPPRHRSTNVSYTITFIDHVHHRSSTPHPIPASIPLHEPKKSLFPSPLISPFLHPPTHASRSLTPGALFSLSSLTIASSGWGGTNVSICTLICSARILGPADADTNPRKGGEGLSGRVQNSGWAWKPTKKGWSASPV